MKSVCRKSMVLFIFGLFLFCCLPFPGFGEEPAQPADPKAAPDFSLKDLSGNTVSLQDFGGKFVLLDFWATWCPPCNQTIPELISLQEKYRDKGLVVLGVSINDPDKMDDRQLAEFVKTKKINYVVLRATEKVMTDYTGSTRPHIPLLYFIDENGTIVDTHQGFEAGALEEKLKKLIP